MKEHTADIPTHMWEEQAVFLGSLNRDLDKTIQTKVSGTWTAGTSGGGGEQIMKVT